MPCPSWITDPSTVLDLTAAMVAVATALSAAELLTIRSEFDDHGLLDPRILTSTRARSIAGRFTIVSMPRVAGAQLALAASVLVLLAFDLSPTVPFVALAATALLHRVLLPYGRDGSDELGRLLTISVAIALVLADDDTVVRIALGFIAAQLCLSYAASGVAKLFGPAWRSGTAIPAILHTTFGHEGKVRMALDRRPSAGATLTWLVVGSELAIPVGIVLGGWVVVAALAAAAALHVAIAVLMGLNRFMPWFLAAFPAALWASCRYGLLSP